MSLLPTYTYACTCTDTDPYPYPYPYTCIYIYIYIYTHTHKRMERDSVPISCDITYKSLGSPGSGGYFAWTLRRPSPADRVLGCR